MARKVAIILLLGVCSLLADSQRPLKMAMDNFFDLVNTAPPPPFQCTSDEPEQEREAQLVQECLLSLCGNPKDNPTNFLTDNNFDQFLKPDQIASLEYLGEKVGEQVEKKYDIFVKTLENDIDHGKIENHIAQWEQSDYESWVRNSLDHQISFKVSKSKELSYSLDILPGTPLAVVEVFRAYAESKKEAIEKSPLAGVEYGLYPFDKAMEIATHYWNMVERLFAKADTKKIDPDPVALFQDLQRKFDWGQLKSIEDLGEFVGAFPRLLPGLEMEIFLG